MHQTVFQLDRFLSRTSDKTPGELQTYCFCAFKIALRHVNTISECGSNARKVFKKEVSKAEFPYLLKIDYATNRLATKATGKKCEQDILR